MIIYYTYIMYNTISLFSGIGGLDLGFIKAGFKVIWANDNAPNTWATYIKNHPDTAFDKRSIIDIPSNQIPDCDAVIGGPPCQSWSAAGSNRGTNDPRGRLFYEYLRVIRDKRPKIFVAENVEGILRKTHGAEFAAIIQSFKEIGYNVTYKLLNASDYDVPQDRKRVIIIGGMVESFQYPPKSINRVTLFDAIHDLSDANIVGVNREDRNIDRSCYLVDGWSPQFMSRNRVRSWNEISYTIPATGRHIPIHPQAPKMIRVNQDKFVFNETDDDHNGQHLYRRFTIHECARIQTFPDDYQLIFDTIDDGYKILGNAVPVNLAYHIANAIKNSTVSPVIKNIVAKRKIIIKPKTK